MGVGALFSFRPGSLLVGVANTFTFCLFLSLFQDLFPWGLGGPPLRARLVSLDIPGVALSLWVNTWQSLVAGPVEATAELFLHGVLPLHAEVSICCFKENFEGMVSRIGGESGPLVVGKAIRQWLEALYVPEVAILQDRGIWRCRQFAHSHRPSVLD